MAERKKNEAEISTRAFPLESPSNNIDSHSIECAVYNVYKHRALRLRSTDWKSSLIGLRLTNVFLKSIYLSVVIANQLSLTVMSKIIPPTTCRQGL